MGWLWFCHQHSTHILGSTTQHNIAAGSLPLDLAKGGGDEGIFEKEEGPHVVKNEDVVLGGQEAAVAMGQQRSHTLIETSAAASKGLEIQALCVWRREGDGRFKGPQGTHWRRGRVWASWVSHTLPPLQGLGAGPLPREMWMFESLAYASTSALCAITAQGRCFSVGTSLQDQPCMSNIKGKWIKAWKEADGGWEGNS